MPSSPKKLSQFWQELKRRNVVRVVTVYAGAAFVIIELINNITEPLRLPEWTPTLVIVLLAIGFPIAIIFSWIYDIHPEGGMVKTEPAEKMKADDIPRLSSGWRIASYISFVVIVGLIVLNVLSRSGKKEMLEKSIAVLPFINDSPDEENTYFINGIMEEVLLNLQSIKELRVPGRTSVEQYRTQNKSIREIAEELGVNYIVEGSGQKYGDRIVLRVQLLEGATDKHLWGDSYEKEIISTEVIIGIQSQIAQAIAAELQAVITPEEKLIIDKIPTTDLTAYDLYQRGMNYYLDFEIKNDLEALERAESYFHEALEIDSTFANAYVGLADIYWDKQYLSEYYLTENYTDSVPVLLNLALSYDEHSSEAYTLRGIYYRFKGNHNLAIKDFEKAIRLNPNLGRAYYGIAGLYQYSDFVKALEFYHKAINIDRGQRLYGYFYNLGWEYFIAGFLDKSRHYYNEALKLVGDSADYYYMMAQNASFSGEDNKVIDYARKVILLDSTSGKVYMAEALLRLGKHKEALAVYESLIDDMNERSNFDLIWAHRIAYAYSINGLTEKAEFYFDMQIEYSLALINLNRPWAQYYFPYYDLAGVYAFRGENEKAYENLNAFNQIKEVPYWMDVLIKRDPLFDSIRDEAEFQQIVSEVEAKYKLSHERVRQWLEENAML
jgi:TolB-like protein/Tfp pilus assembly protein PilF